MATFKVGQRVRVIGCMPNSECARKRAVGREAVITAIPSRLARGWEDAINGTPDCDILVDGESRDWLAFFHFLAPLTDPKAEEFIEGLKKLGREPAPREEEAFAKVRKLLEQSE